jgi:hypothetical protein
MILALRTISLKPFNMRNIFSLCFCAAIGLLFSINIQSQGLKDLETNNGFKKYKLGSKFAMGLGVKQKDEDGADKVIVDYTKDVIGDIPVKSIELYYVKDTLAKIIVRISPEYYEKLNELTRNAFGQPTQDFSYNEKARIDSVVAIGTYKDHYMWKTARINLQYFYNYPKTSGGAYGNKTLYLSYSLNDYGQRLARSKKGQSSAKNF